VLKRGISVPQAIREAVDFCPGGLCFSMPDGRPILVNRQMNTLSAALTGHTVLDAEAFWAELGRTHSAGGCVRLKAPWDEDGGESRLGFAFPDGRVWLFRRSALTDGRRTYIQTEAEDITELYGMSEELYRNNLRLRDLRERQKNLLANIVQINREKELLAVKMRVHDELGQCLVATKKALREQTVKSDAPALAKGWEDAVRDFFNIPLENADSGESAEAELLRVADMTGCRIDFTGERPAGRGARLLLYAAVREALTNAVRHANADRLTVDMRRCAGGFRAEISDNGRADVSGIVEGGGLGNLRRRLEREGASLDIRCRGGVTLEINIPLGSDERTGGENHD
jgi:signal transduction histidine kinase